MISGRSTTSQASITARCSSRSNRSIPGLRSKAHAEDPRVSTVADHQGPGSKVTLSSTCSVIAASSGNVSRNHGECSWSAWSVSAGVKFVLPVDEDRRSLQDCAEPTGLVLKPESEQKLELLLAFWGVLNKRLIHPGTYSIGQAD